MPIMTVGVDTSPPAAVVGTDVPDAGFPRTPGESIARQVHSSLELLSNLYNYNHWLYNKVRPFIRGRVCEVGCGTGNITRFLLDCEHVTGIEPESHSFTTAKERFSQHHNIRFVNGVLEDCPGTLVPAGSFDTVMCFNVLEHLADDVDSLSRMRMLCNQFGRVIILVPAHNSIYGELDRVYGHYRRYTRRTLAKAFTQAGLHVSYSLYMNFLGYFGWWWNSKIRKRTQIPYSSAWLFNRMVTFLDPIERLIHPPIGQTLIMIGEVQPRR